MFSALTLFDLVAYLLSGSALLAGTYWALAGVPETEPGASIVLAFAVAAYVAGHAIAALTTLGRYAGRAAGRRLLKSGHEWLGRHLPGEHTWALDLEKRSPAARTHIREALAGYGQVDEHEQLEIARILLSRHGADERLTAMTVGYWTTLYLMTATWLLACVFTVAALWRPGPLGLLLAALGAALVGCLFRWRAQRFNGFVVEAASYGVLALSVAPDRLSSSRDAS